MSEQGLLDAGLIARDFTDETRRTIWASVDDILAHGPLSTTGQPGATGLALGYVQSGKTTAITALVAAASDSGYRVVVALLGSTNLLLAQNSERLLAALKIGTRTDYRWVHMPNAAGVIKAKELATWLERGRTILLPVLKHAGRIDALTDVLTRANASRYPTLIIDDEADQASLNTQVSADAESRTYGAVGKLRESVPQHVYVQFTATPYAPLLLEQDDHLAPDFVELLQPGPGYTGGREFFVDHADVVIRAIPTLDEQPPKSPPTVLPNSLITATASFVAGSALLLTCDATATPVSMLVHSTQRNDVQARYHFLLQRHLRKWCQAADAAASEADLPKQILDERDRIVGLGAPAAGADFLSKVRYVLGEATLWLVNSASDVNKVDWKVAPVHILVGGNKLDRGFTVEGLTVTYMNRPPSQQIDTLEQRARAYGYRGDLLPYCQFFASPRTLKVLKEIVDTEYDLRARLRDWLDGGGTVREWAQQIGLLLPVGTKPSRQNVLGALTRFNEGTGWHQLRRPSTRTKELERNAELVRSTGLLDAAPRGYGRLEHPTLDLRVSDAVSLLLAPWEGSPTGASPGWRHDELVDLLTRHPSDEQVPVILMRHPNGGSRERNWDHELGFINLMQGADLLQVPGEPSYPGDRALGGVAEHPERIVIQVHHVRPAGSFESSALFTLAIHAGERAVVRRELS